MVSPSATLSKLDTLSLAYSQKHKNPKSSSSFARQKAIHSLRPSSRLVVALRVFRVARLFYRRFLLNSLLSIEKPSINWLSANIRLISCGGHSASGAPRSGPHFSADTRIEKGSCVLRKTIIVVIIIIGSAGIPSL